MGHALSTANLYASVIVNEMCIKRTIERKQEPDLIMTDPNKVKSYFEASNEYQGSVYTFILANLCELIKPGDRVLDLGCGSGNMLSIAADAFKDANFVGLDLSDNMLHYSKQVISDKQLTNVELIKGDMTKLSELFGEHSFDVVMSSGAFHHLPDEVMLRSVFEEIEKVLKSGMFLFKACLFSF